MRTSILFISLIASVLGFAKEPIPPDSTSLLQNAVWAFEDGQFSEAYALWEEYASTEEAVDPTVYYNMGNAAWRGGEIGEAIWNWNRALKLDPDMKDAKFNLQFTDDVLVDRIRPLDKSPVDEVIEKIWSALTPQTWGLISLFSFLGMMVFFAVFKYGNFAGSRIFMPLAFVLLFTGIAAGGIGWKHQYELDNTLTAVVLEPNVYIKSAPMIGAGDAFILHEGTQMDVQKTAGDWLEIHLADGKVGWVQSEYVGVY
ncbi:tetratricopeptide repeat protein [Phaeocystidibacter luteus]|uniref:Uncharacterized protein n=1 Tax=Phaeocystidibacter luteus TaxID=911197 RepID=A0A6N6RH61_9FLAO|nr:hypothetical protein [Phaeocystidibacter luteus]KAB2808602.1 hypothetical protein F8C67_09955 [Phaeocystidibacter luteus]